MPEQALMLETKPLSQVERVTDTFLAPSRTFTDVLRNGSWWLPFLFLVLGAGVLTTAVQTRVGWTQLVQNEIRNNPKMSDAMASLPPEQAAPRQRMMRMSYMYGFYASPLINLASLAVMALVFWPTINFAFAGTASYGKVLCVLMYAALPGVLAALLGAMLLFAGRSPETFTTQALIGSNPGYYMDTPGVLKTVLSSLDVFTIWTAVLMSLGLAIVARTKASAGYITVFGWWILVILVKTAVASISM